MTVSATPDFKFRGITVLEFCARLRDKKKTWRLTKVQRETNPARGPSTSVVCSAVNKPERKRALHSQRNRPFQKYPDVFWNILKFPRYIKKI